MQLYISLVILNIIKGNFKPVKARVLLYHLISFQATY